MNDAERDPTTVVEPDADVTAPAPPPAHAEAPASVEDTLRAVSPLPPRRPEIAAPRDAPEADAATIRREVRERRSEAISQSIERLQAEDVDELPTAQKAALVGQIAQGARVELGTLREEAAEARLMLRHLYELAARVRDDRQTVPRQVRIGNIPGLGAIARWESLQDTNAELQEAIDRAFTERLRLLSDTPEAEAAVEQVASLRRDMDNLFDESLRPVLEDAEGYLEQRLAAMHELLNLYNEQAAVATDAYDESSRYAEELSAAMVAARERGLLARSEERVSLETFSALAASLASLPEILEAARRQYYEFGNPPPTMLAFFIRLFGSILLLIGLVILWLGLPAWLVAVFNGRNDNNHGEGPGNGNGGDEDTDPLLHRHAELITPVGRAVLLAMVAASALHLWGLPGDWIAASLAFIGAWAAYFAIVAVAREMLAPNHESLRIIRMDTPAATALFRLLRTLALWSVSLLSFIWVLTLLDYPYEDVLVLLSVIHVVGLAIIAGWLVYGSGGPCEFIEEAQRRSRRPVRRVAATAVPIVLATAALIALLKALGYVNFGSYLARIIYLNVPLVLAALLATWLIRARLAPGCGWRRWSRIIVWTTVVLAQIPILGLRWHHGQAAYELMQRPLFAVAEAEVSVISLIQGIVVIVIAWAIARLLRRRLANSERLLDRFNEGVVYALSSLTFYVILIAGILWAMLAGGFPLNALTVLAGMAGIGLGFGMQDIVRNFFAGLILLIERPLAVGDYIEISSTWGRVVSISLRSTTVRTQNNVHILVPNGDIISEHLTNLSHHDLALRVCIPVGVSYDSDLDRVYEVLLEVAREHEDVSEFPPPCVRLISFGESSIKLELRVWVDDPAIHRSTTWALNLDIWRALKREGIEIPFPQRDLHLRSASAPLSIESTETEE